MSDNGRDEQGRFAVGNAGGPGRPRRAIEREYILAVTEAVSLDDWRAIVSRAKADALNGDDKARAWLSRFLVGDDRISLLQLAALERLGIDVDREVAGAADLIQNPSSLFTDGPQETIAERALLLLNQERFAAVERLKRKAEEREAQKATTHEQ